MLIVRGCAAGHHQTTWHQRNDWPCVVGLLARLGFGERPNTSQGSVTMFCSRAACILSSVQKHRGNPEKRHRGQAGTPSLHLKLPTGRVLALSCAGPAHLPATAYRVGRRGVALSRCPLSVFLFERSCVPYRCLVDLSGCTAVITLLSTLRPMSRATPDEPMYTRDVNAGCPPPL
jgi:hypothetical protein